MTAGTIGQRPLLRECKFCGSLFGVPEPPKHTRQSCDTCRTRTAVQRRSDDGRRDQVYARKLEWNAANLDRVRAYSRGTYYRHHEKYAENARSYRAENREKIAAYMHEYRKGRPDAVVEAELRRRARKVSAAGKATAAQVRARREVYGHCCAYCGAAATVMDHVIPMSRGGTNWPSNLRPACLSCNSSKRDKLLHEWLPYRRGLAGSRNQWAATAA